jgi:hypothetical protein
MSKTQRVYIKTIFAVIILSLSFTHNLPSEKVLASPTLGNATKALENATAALNNATKALRDAGQQPARDDVEGVSNNSTIHNSTLSIETSREKYAIGAPIQIFGNLTTTNGTIANTPIRITISPTSAESQSVVINTILNLINDTFSYVGSKPQEPIVNMTLGVINGSYSYRGLIPFKEAGIYKVNSTATDNKTALAFIELVDLFRTASIGCLIAALVFFSILTITIYWYGRKRKGQPIADTDNPFNDEHLHRAEIWRFIALTGISLSLILSLLFIEVEVNPNGPLGLVNINSNGELNNNAAFTEWTINIGGSSNDNYESGLIIPVYVITLGLIGGYMRYLHKAYAKTEIKDLADEKKKLREHEGTANGFVHFSLGELSDILIAPILAIAVWFIVHQEIQSVFLLAALSLTLGLATPNIISGLKGFASSTSGSPTSGSPTSGSPTSGSPTSGSPTSGSSAT